jgi:hypothetical protein
MKTSWFLFVLSMTGVIPIADAEEHCADRDTPRQCLQRLNVEQAVAAAQAPAATANTGTNTPGTPARSALKDFLSVVSANVEGSVLSDVKDESIVLGYNLPVDPFGKGIQLRPEMVFAKPKLSEAVQSVAGSSLPALKNSLSAASDVLASLSFNVTSRTFGRSLAPHHALFDSMLTAVLTSQGDTGLGGVPLSSFDQPFDAIAPDDTARAGLITAFEGAARTSLPAVAENLVKGLGVLLNNQPQIYASVNYHLSKEIGGPRSYSAIVTWEIGSQNLNGFYAHEGHDCEATNTCVGAFERYMKRTRKALMADRLALTIEYNRTLKSLPKLPDDTSPLFVTPQQTGYIYAIAYGRPFASFLTGQEGRIDFTYAFDGKSTSRNVGVATGPVRTASFAMVTFSAGLQSVPPPRDRYVATGTYTQKLTDGLSVPFSVIWSNHEESFPGPCTVINASPAIVSCKPTFTTGTRKVTLRTGINFKIPSVRRPKSCGCCCPGGR